MSHPLPKQSMRFANRLLTLSASLLVLASCAPEVSRQADAQAASVAANKAVVRRFFTEVWGGGSEAVAQELLADAYVGHMTGSPAPLDRAGWLAFFREFRVAFPDAQFTIEDMIAEGDRVVMRLTMRGTHRGVFNGIAATGKSVVVAGTSIERVADGRIVEGWVTNDALGLLQQLGVLPGPPAP